MAVFLSWLGSHGDSLFQNLSVIIGFALTALGLRHQAKAKEIENIQALARDHRDLWKDASRRPELRRILRLDVDLVREPMTVAEEEFLNLTIIHFETGWQMAMAGTVLKKTTLEADAGRFFSRPLPNEVWRKTKDCHDPAFVRFVDRALDRHERLRAPQA